MGFTLEKPVKPRFLLQNSNARFPLADRNLDWSCDPRSLLHVSGSDVKFNKYEAHPMILIQYIDPRRLPLDNRGLKKDILIDKAKIVVQFCHRPGENPLAGGLLLSLLLRGLSWRGLLLLRWWRLL